MLRSTSSITQGTDIFVTMEDTGSVVVVVEVDEVGVDVGEVEVVEDMVVVADVEVDVDVDGEVVVEVVVVDVVVDVVVVVSDVKFNVKVITPPPFNV